MNVLSKTRPCESANTLFNYNANGFLFECEKTAAEISAADAMYQFIDMSQLLNAFYLKLVKTHQIDRIEVQLPQASYYSGLSVPRVDSFKQSYRVKCDLLERDRKAQPKIIVYRSYKFQISELTDLDVLIRRFSGPFRNSVSYTNACHAASHDCLTDLYNRNEFNKCLSKNSSIGALIVCDIDNFKSINDRHGHQVGDNVLKQFAGLLQAVSPGKNLVYRYGGDEFVIVHSKSCSDSAWQVAKRVRSTVEKTPVIVSGHPLKMTTTIGVSAILRGESIETAFHRADRALMHGKKHGRNQVFLAGAAVRPTIFSSVDCAELP